METILAPLDLQLSHGMSSYTTESLTTESHNMRLRSLYSIGLTAPTTITSSTDWSPRFVGMNDGLGFQLKEKGLARLPSIGVMINRGSLSPVQKHYKERQNFKTVSPELELHSLAADMSVNLLSKHPTPALSRFNTNHKTKRTNNAKLCGMTGCHKRAKAGGFCIAHGGGLRCSKTGCAKHAVSLGLCISHGGGKRCVTEGCLNASRKNGVCWSHGGKRLCKIEGCNKGPKSGGYCWSHGGKMKK